MKLKDTSLWSCATSALVGVFLIGPPAHGQFAKFPAKSVPRTSSGEPNLKAPVRRTADGKPDLSGVWLITRDVPITEQSHTSENYKFRSRVTGVSLSDIKVEDMKPWAVKLFLERQAMGDLAQPQANCKPSGIPELSTLPLPYKIVHTPDLVLILYEENTVFRQIFLDGRKPAKDAVPRWLGYSTGRWQGDELVVETTGFTEDLWLDGAGHPHSDSMVMTERFRRLDAGHLEVQITLDDPKTYNKLVSYTVNLGVVPDDDLYEYFCTENEKASAHYQGGGEIKP